MAPTDPNAAVDALVAKRQRLRADLEANRRLLIDALHAQAVANGTKP